MFRPIYKNYATLPHVRETRHTSINFEQVQVYTLLLKSFRGYFSIAPFLLLQNLKFKHN